MPIILATLLCRRTHSAKAKFGPRVLHCSLELQAEQSGRFFNFCPSIWKQTEVATIFVSFLADRHSPLADNCAPLEDNYPPPLDTESFDGLRDSGPAINWCGKSSQWSTLHSSKSFSDWSVIGRSAILRSDVSSPKEYSSMTMINRLLFHGQQIILEQ